MITIICVIFVLLVPEIFRNEGRLGARMGTGERGTWSLSTLLPEASPCLFPLTPLPKTQRGSAAQMHSSWGPLMVTAFQWGCVCPVQACHVAGSAGGAWQGCGAVKGRQIPGSFSPRWRHLPQGRAGSASQLSQPCNCQAEDRKPAWLLALGLGTVGGGPRPHWRQPLVSRPQESVLCLARGTQACGISPAAL